MSYKLLLGSCGGPGKQDVSFQDSMTFLRQFRSPPPLVVEDPISSRPPLVFAIMLARRSNLWKKASYLEWGKITKPPRGFLTPIPVGERENILRVSPDPNQQRSAVGVITAGVHVSGTRPLSSFLQHPPEDTRTLLCDLRHAKKKETHSTRMSFKCKEGLHSYV